MIFNKNIDKGTLKKWRFSGRCKDSKGKLWNFYTNLKEQFDKFKIDKYHHGMNFIGGKENKNYKVVRKLTGETDE